jgi:putative phosphoribosyl transferase
VAEGGALAINEDMLAVTGASSAYVEQQAPQQRAEIARRRVLYLNGQAPIDLAGRTAVVVDDGMATGATMRAALRCLQQRHPARTVLAVPVASREAVALARPLVSELVCLQMPWPFHAVGLHYGAFDQVSDDEVIALMREFSAAPPA